MKHLKRWICLFSLLLLLTLAACGNTGEQGAVVTPTVSPTVGVEETFSPSQQPSGEPKASEAPAETQQPAAAQGISLEEAAACVWLLGALAMAVSMRADRAKITNK